jgi:predicted RNase H-like nuclease (RuvC/YqgF family)
MKWVNIFFEIENLRKKVIEMLDAIQKAEERNEELYKALISSEEECMRLQNENDRLQAKLKVNEKILKAVGK